MLIEMEVRCKQWNVLATHLFAATYDLSHTGQTTGGSVDDHLSPLGTKSVGEIGLG